MSLYKELAYDNGDIDSVTGVQFCIMSPEDIRSRSAVEVTSHTYAHNEPVHGGLFDRRMGVVEPNVLCQTCEQRNDFCPGHFGHIELAKPVFHVHFFEMIRKLLRCICFRCSRVPIVLEDSPEVQAIQAKRLSRQKRWELMHKLLQKVKKCPHCGMKQPDKSTRSGILRIELEWRPTAAQAAAAQDTLEDSSNSSTNNNNNNKVILCAEDVLRMFRRMTDDDISLLGFCKHQNRPEWMVCTVLLVPPPAVRPTVKNEVGQRQEDDLTTKLMSIVKHNATVKAKLEKGQLEQADQYVKLLQYEVATLIDNNVQGIPPSQVMRTGRPIRALTERLKSKEGRIRGNLMGKRVDFSARSVITPDPNISIDELGVPERIAMNLTMPEVVNRFTIERLKAMVSNGPEKYPGVKFVKKINEVSRTIRLKSLTPEELKSMSESLVDGDIVERHLLDGDVVLFNRQPSLHKMSMMGHRVRVMPFNTFRLNVCVTPNFNADFDGDEMNMHVPQSLQTHEELAELATVMNQIISPRECKPIISVVQDIALGIYRMTRKDSTGVSERQLMNLIAPRSHIVPMKRNGMRLGGHDLLSTVIPKGLWTTCQGVVVRDGEIMEGSAAVTKKVYQDQSNGLVHAIHNSLGKEATRQFFDDTQKLVCDFLVLDGFSVGISDLVVPPSTRDGFREIFKNLKKHVQDVVKSVHEGTLENTSNKTFREFFEGHVIDIVNDARNKISKLAGSEVGEKDNRLLSMINNSKGSDINVVQMVGCVGQVNVDGNKRIPYGFDSRTLPHYTRYDDGPEARGFVRSSFIGGLTPQEFFFHSMGGREGLIDTAVKSVTRETPIVIIEDGVSKRVEIGAWIDEKLLKDMKSIRMFPDEKNMELLELKERVSIPTCDKDGNVTWGLMTHVTRHNPGLCLYRVTTQSGREVTVADSKSLLVWNSLSEEFVQTESKDVKPGDFLPVTMNLPEPHEVVKEVNIVDYLPKTEYVYGTDFNVALRYVMTRRRPDIGVCGGPGDFEELDSDDDSSDCSDRSTEDAQGNLFHIPRGWWAANNGTTFTLPYPKKSLLTRATSGRSNVDNILDGHVYPYNATRCHGHMPDKFVLNKENGVFIGLFLADGHACDKSGQVGISKNEKSVQDFAKTWFEKHGFKTRLQANTHPVLEKTSYTMFGYSSLLARFLDMFVGQGSRNKYVPDVAFVAPEEFVIGLLSGYFSGDGSIGKGCITSSSASRRMTEGISMLCTRLGAFGKVSMTVQESNNLGTQDIAPMHRLHIHAHWTHMLQAKLDLVHLPKKEAFDSLIFKDRQQKHTRNDVVLDQVKSIEVIGVDEHPKLYDVTVPSTLNFCLANGLGVRDTSETGYIQRKLVKAMEDFKIHHDGTVRNAAGSIIEFLYGEDGMDPIRIERQKLPHIFSTPAGLEEEFMMTDEELSLYYQEEDIDDVKAVLRARLDVISEDRDFIILKMFGGKKEVGEIEFPVNVARIMASSRDSRDSKNHDFSGDPVSDIISKVDALFSSLRVNRANACPKIFGVILRSLLAPKAVLKTLSSMSSFDMVLDRIRRDFEDAIADASEMVGVVAAQSISEPTTQLSIMSGMGVLVQRRVEDGGVYYGPIGELIDGIMLANKDVLIDLGGGSSVLDLKGEHTDMFIVGVSSDDEKTSWRRISQVSRHPAKGGMVRIKTRSGKSVTATLSHSFLKRTERGIEPVLGSNLSMGDRVPVARFVPTPSAQQSSVLIGAINIALTRDFGWLCGAYIADGYVDKNTISISKVIPEFQDKLREVLSGVFGLKMRQYKKVAGGNPQMLHGWDMSKYPGCENAVNSADLSKFMLDSFNTGSHDKRLPGWIYAADIEFVKGVICGYFDGDGNVNGVGPKSMIRSASVSENLTQDMILLLTRVGIFASKCLEKHIAEPNRNDLHTIQIPRKYARTFRDSVGPMVVHEKAAALEEIISYVEREVTTIHSSREDIDKIPELGSILAHVGKALRMPGHSRLYGRFSKKESIGRETLRKYVGDFERTLGERYVEAREQHDEFMEKFEKMRIEISAAAVDHRGVMDADPTKLRDLCDIRTRLLGSKGLGGSNLFTNLKNSRITSSIYSSHIDKLQDATLDYLARELVVLDDVRDDKLLILKRALDADVVWDEIVEIERLPDPGEMVYDFTVPGNDSFMVDCGVLVHNTLNTFHTAGVASASSQVRGVPRLKEIIDCTASKNIKTPVMSISFNKDIRCNKIGVIDMMNRLRMIRFKDIVSRSRIYFDPAETIGAPSHMEQDSLFIELYTRFDSLSTSRVDFSPWVLRLEFDRQRMHTLSLNMADVDRVLAEFYDDKVSCVFSDDNAGEMAMRVRLAIGERSGDDDLLTELKALEHNIIETLKIRGVEGIEKVVIRETLRQQRYNVELKVFEPFSEYVVETDGSNLLGVMGVPGIDWKRTTTNDIYEVFHTLGVEAARQKLHDEIVEVLSMTYINYRHVALLVDAITNKGTMVSVNRHGINQGDNGPLAKCSFEETVVRLVNAGIFSERDRVNGVSANIMLGQVAPCGTGDSKILLDLSRLPEPRATAVDVVEDEDDEDEDVFSFDLKV